VIRALCVSVVLVAAGCTGEGNIPDTAAGRTPENQKPSNLTPGVHVSGHVNVGVKRTF